MAEGILGKLDSAYELTKNLMDVRDAVSRQSAVLELQKEIIAAQQSAMQSNREQSALVEQIRSLEEEVARLKRWEAEKQNYELRPVTTGAFAYVPKSEVEAGKEVHRYCANCFDAGEKSIMQAVTRTPNRAYVHVCHRCGSEIYEQGHWVPLHGSTKSASRR